jgi:hypothetical protein
MLAEFGKRRLDAATKNAKAAGATGRLGVSRAECRDVLFATMDGTLWRRLVVECGGPTSATPTGTDPCGSPGWSTRPTRQRDQFASSSVSNRPDGIPRLAVPSRQRAHWEGETVTRPWPDRGRGLGG